MPQHDLNDAFVQGVSVNVRCILERTFHKLRVVGKGGVKRSVWQHPAVVILAHFSLMDLSLFIYILILEHVDITLIINEC